MPGPRVGRGALRAGVCLYIITTGTLPFDEPNLTVMFDKIARADYPPAPWWSPELAHLIHHILMPDPLQRCACWRRRQRLCALTLQIHMHR